MDQQVSDLRATLERHPYGALAAALGVGYALGGGIFTPLTARIVRAGLRIGVRVALLPMVTERLSDLVGDLAPAKPEEATPAPEAAEA
jgi:hypothetical protein